MSSTTNAAVAAVRQFNRFYTRHVGALDAGHLGSRYSLTEVRILFELAQRDDATASELGTSLGLDAGYLSRILRRFERAKLITRVSPPHDRRRNHIRLTRAGRDAFAPLNKRATADVASMLAPLGTHQRRKLVEAMRHIQSTFGSNGVADRGARGVVLRRHRPGDMGWVVHRHGALYAREYGYNDRFEALVARIVADFIDHYDAERERCWIADRGGEIVGSVFLVRKTRTVAKLRMLYLEPSARGLGLGRRLVDECIEFARAAGYRKITLWTQSSLTAARHIYQATGFELKDTKPHADFGPAELAETWELTL